MNYELMAKQQTLFFFKNYLKLNLFSTGILNILEVAGIHRSALRPAGRPTAYKLLPTGSWRSEKEEVVFPRTFPWEFSLLVTVRVKKSSSGGFLLRVLHSESLQVSISECSKGLIFW